MAAARKTLDKRGDGGTGWSKAWKINMWARLRDGDRAHRLLSQQLSESTLKNLFDTHPPFQIDGNFGATAGVAEMLLQSQGEYVEPLCALPSKWDAGSYKGMKARGNFEISTSWEDGRAETFNIKSGSGNECKFRYEGIADYTVADMTNAEFIEPTVIDDNTISFPTQAGAEYVISTQSITLPEKPVQVIDDTNNNQNNVPINGTTNVTTPTNNQTDTASEAAPAAPAIKSLKASKGGKAVLKIKKKVSEASGYQIRYALKKNMKSAKTLKFKGTSKSKFTIKKLKKKTYYVQIRAYKTSGSKTLYSKWSGKKKVKIK